ncbi:MAG: hypothetical protein WAT12_06340, partial [Candidatus Nitrotoga sp.]
SDRGYPPQSRIEDFYVICSKINQKDEAGCDWIGVPPRSGLVQRKVDTRKNAGKSTFEVYNLKIYM